MKPFSAAAALSLVFPALLVAAAPLRAAITLSFSSPASNVSACDLVSLSWSATGPADIASVFVQSASLVQTVAENVKATDETTVAWIADVPSGWYTLTGRANANIHDVDVEVVPSPAFFVGAASANENGDLACHAGHVVKVVSAAQTTPEAATNTRRGPNPGAVAGAVVGVILVIVLASTLLWHYRAREHAPASRAPAVQRHELDRRDSDSTVVDIVGRPPTPLGIAVLGRTASKPLDPEQTQKVLRGL